MDQVELEKITERVRKLFALAAKNSNEAEATAAAVKAQELLAAYNLDLATVERGSNASGAREDAKVKGGMYHYERELWNAVARLNFCFYFTTRQKIMQKRGYRDHFWQFAHRIVGRKVNTAATRVMAQYLITTIERLCRERLQENFEGKVNSQFFSRWAVGYREGIADRVIEKLRERRQHLINEETRKKEEAEKAAKQSARKQASTTTALTLTALAKSEEAANYDFLHGEGAWDRKEARILENEKNWEKERKRQAKAEAAAEAAYAQWAKANPEEAAKEERKRAAKERKSWSRRSYRYRYRARDGRELRRDSGGYYAGYDKGAEVGIDPQMDNGSQRKLR